MRASDVKTSAYLSAEVDSAIESASQTVDELCSRGDSVRPGFAPWTGSISLDWPSETTAQSSSFRLWLAPNALLSLTSIVSGGIDVTSTSYGSPADLGAPYSAVSLDRGGAGILSPGSAAGQRSAVVTGVWGATPLVEDTRTAWVTAGATLSSSATTVQLNALFGVGSIVRLDSERMFVTDRAWTSSSQTGSLAANTTAVALTVSDGTAFFAGEEIMLDSEIMRVLAI